MHQSGQDSAITMKGGNLMKKLWCLLICIIFLTGCSKAGGDLDAAVKLRSAILSAETCSFTAVITADYGDMIHEFTLKCISDGDGNVTFSVIGPESIAGITGKITADGGAITFDDTVLAIPLLTDNQLTPVSAPWIMMRALRSGFIASAGSGRIRLDDSYADDALALDIVLDDSGMPSLAEIFWKNRRILTIHVISFSLS